MFRAAARVGSVVICRKIPGAVRSIDNGALAMALEPRDTTSSPRPGMASGGNWKLICVGLTYNRGTCLPATPTLMPPSVIGSGLSVAVAVALARLLPKIVCIEPGAAPAVKLAAFTTAMTTGSLRVTEMFCRLNTAVPSKPAAVAITNDRLAYGFNNSVTVTSNDPSKPSLGAVTLNNGTGSDRLCPLPPRSRQGMTYISMIP